MHVASALLEQRAIALLVHLWLEEIAIMLTLCTNISYSNTYAHTCCKQMMSGR